jgi:hypothetical protein
MRHSSHSRSATGDLDPELAAAGPGRPGVWIVRVLVAYAIVGLGLGIYAATREYQDGSLPHDNTSAGVVGLFVACFWPVVVVIIALGIAANYLARLIGGHR